MTPAEQVHSGNYTTVKEASDPFNGIVAIFEDKEVTEANRYWVEHQRKDMYSDFVTLEEAEKIYQGFVNDTAF